MYGVFGFMFLEFVVYGFLVRPFAIQEIYAVL